MNPRDSRSQTSTMIGAFLVIVLCALFSSTTTIRAASLSAAAAAAAADDDDSMLLDGANLERDEDPDTAGSQLDEDHHLAAAHFDNPGNKFLQQQQQHADEGLLDADELEPNVLDTNNIENAKLAYTANELDTAAGHHHHHHHSVHGWLDMGAHTGKKGSFGWHDKHPVGGKGRR